ncbi:MAG: HesA/MoeB/ThiF family protein [Promethearchaeota archaeon]
MSEIKYDRQSRIPKWDQKKISNAKVAVIGAGALGNHVCLGLIGLGVGSIKIFDYDEIETHNLNRQSLFREDDIGQNKAESLAELLKERNSSIEIIGIDEKIEEDTIEDIIRDVDVIIDCVDLIYVRNILNKFCIERDIPLIHGGISWTGGQTGILTRKTPCIKCIYPDALQKEELDTETSCIRNPEASVVYISQIIAGLMVYNVRQVILPLPSDLKPPSGLFKLDLRLENPFYFEKITRKKKCDCVKLLKKVAPAILKEEKEILKKLEKENLKELQKTVEMKTDEKSKKKTSSIKKKTSKRAKKSKISKKKTKITKSK